MPRNSKHSLFRPARTHGIGAGSDDDFVYRRYHVTLQGRFSGNPTYWIERDGIVVYRSAKSPQDAKAVIDDLAQDE